MMQKNFECQKLEYFLKKWSDSRVDKSHDHEVAVCGLKFKCGLQYT